MREILFRGKDKNGKWEYGFLSYASQEEIYYIGVTELLTPVDPNTVGQFTGLLDKNGEKIFEGDVINVNVGHESRKNDNFLVLFRLGCASIWLGNSETPVSFACYQDQIWYNIGRSFENNIEQYIEVIGNVYDNPDLFKIKN